MRTSIAFLVLVAICGCSNRLEPLAQGLEAAWKPEQRQLKLALRADSKNGRWILHCVMSNVYSQSIDVDASGLPWLNADLFSVDAVTASGKVIHKDPPAIWSRISGPPRPVSIAPGQFMEGEIELTAMRVGDLPRHEDLLLLWSYWMSDGHAGGTGVQLSGVTLLKAI